MNKLIKFSPYNKYLLEGMNNQTLFFNNLCNYNDPFEGVFRYNLSTNFEQFKDFYLKQYRGSKNMLEFYFNNKIELEKLLNRSFDWRQKKMEFVVFQMNQN
ncbi:MAG: hypothetical protein N4A45_13525 [Flavobacteriales bacterium]|jgi:hypothetical protein|nr:hypothetical protein [Flavobacteriales bacterium]